MGRRLKNWLDTFVEYTKNLPSPALFRQWAGIYAVSAALERKVWTDIGRGPLYPNQYITLVGPPGVGKTVVTSIVYDMLASLNPNLDKNGFHLASSSLTSASIIDELEQATRNIVFDDMSSASFNSLSIVSNEMGVLLPDYDPAFMNKLTDIYDGKPYSERRRTKELNLQIQKPQLSMLAATTPGYLTSMLPEGAWDQGFLSRTILAFSPQTMTTELFLLNSLDKKMEKDLIHDLTVINGLHGPIGFSKEAANALNAWHMAGGPPQPEHPKLAHYVTRRTAHLTKLCIACAVASHDSLEITIDDYQLAMDYFVVMETVLSDIFKAMAAGGDRQAIDEAWHYFAAEYGRTQHPIAENRIIQYLAERVPAYSVSTIFDIMQRAGIFQDVTMETKAPGKWWKPKPRKRADL